MSFEQSSDHIYIYERATASERCLYNEAKNLQLAKLLSVKYVWLRGIHLRYLIINSHRVDSNLISFLLLPFLLSPCSLLQTLLVMSSHSSPPSSSPASVVHSVQLSSPVCSSICSNNAFNIAHITLLITH